MSRKAELIELIEEGLGLASKLPNRELKRVVIFHFEAFKTLLGEKDDELKRIVMHLIIGVKEALIFRDTDILMEVESEVRKALGNFR